MGKDKQEWLWTEFLELKPELGSQEGNASSLEEYFFKQKAWSFRKFKQVPLQLGAYSAFASRKVFQGV